jgi:hypothetical protein
METHVLAEAVVGRHFLQSQIMLLADLHEGSNGQQVQMMRGIEVHPARLDDRELETVRIRQSGK